MKDERVRDDVRRAKSVGYSVFWYCIFAVLLYRWYYLGQSVMETLDIFIIWLSASVIQFVILAAKGIPLTYPVSTNRKEQKFFPVVASLINGIFSASLIALFKEDAKIALVFGGFVATFLATLMVYALYSAVIHVWEKRNLE